METLPFGTCSRSAMSSTIALFAFPSTGGALTAIPNAFLQGLYPSGNLEILLPADTSIMMMIPSAVMMHASSFSSPFGDSVFFFDIG